jgi:AmiR/NasT family two-component response regulator
VASIVLLNVISPSKLSGELELFGHQVWEALDVSEVLFLCEQHRVDAVIIAAQVAAGEIIEKQLRGTVMRLKSNANAAYVDWELAQLFPKKDVRIQ